MQFNYTETGLNFLVTIKEITSKFSYGNFQFKDVNLFPWYTTPGSYSAITEEEVKQGLKDLQIIGAITLDEFGRFTINEAAWNDFLNKYPC